MKKKTPKSAPPSARNKPKATPPLPVYNLGKELVDIADRDALENAMRPDERFPYRVASTNWLPSGS